MPSAFLFWARDGQYHLQFIYGGSQEDCEEIKAAGDDGIIDSRGQERQIPCFSKTSPPMMVTMISGFLNMGMTSMAYIPVSAREKKVFGVIRIGSRASHHFSHEEKRVLEIIGNRIGAAIENSLLQEELVNSEEKYRSLFRQ
jgi:GAF domain-containing protein